MNRFKDAFDRLAEAITKASGSVVASAAALLLVVGWTIVGMIVGFSDTHQLIINTTTTIVTFLMVFVIQNSQNRDSRAVNAKLDELVRVTRAHNDLIDAEHQSEEAIERMKQRAQKGAV